MTHACDRHPPGTVTCYKLCRCKCTPCTGAYRSYSKRIRLHPRRVDATGTQRRIQALATNGWPLTWLSARLGLSPDLMGARLGRTYVTPETADQVRCLYDQLWDEQPRPVDAYARRAASRSRNRAERAGWAPAAAWDEGTGPHGIDNPDAKPQGVRTPTRQVPEEDVVWLLDLGETPEAIAQRLGLQRDSVTASARRWQYRQQHHDQQGAA